MAVTYTSFKAAFPEFTPAEDSLVTTKIAAAQLQINSTVWGSRYDEGVMWLTAILLASSPYGEQSRLSDDKSKTVYHENYNRLRSIVTAGLR